MLLKQMRAMRELTICAMILGATQVRPVAAQSPATWDAGRLQLTRAELQLLLDKFESTGRSASYSSDFKLRAQNEAALVRDRLREGDFQVGDQIWLMVEGEQNMPVTLAVEPGRVLNIPSFGQLALTGVLRSELTDKVREHIARFLQSPNVQTRSLIRLAITGQVARPGFFTLPAESIISEAIMAAGGPTGNANIRNVSVERGMVKLWDGRVFQQALADGRTLDQMSLRSGDQITVSSTSQGFSSGLMRAATVVPAALLAIVGLMRTL